MLTLTEKWDLNIESQVSRNNFYYFVYQLNLWWNRTEISSHIVKVTLPKSPYQSHFIKVTLSYYQSHIIKAILSKHNLIKAIFCKRNISSNYMTRQTNSNNALGKLRWHCGRVVCYINVNCALDCITMCIIIFQLNFGRVN